MDRIVTVADAVRYWFLVGSELPHGLLILLTTHSSILGGGKGI
jgi:hypothetical protein